MKADQPGVEKFFEGAIDHSKRAEEIHERILELLKEVAKLSKESAELSKSNQTSLQKKQAHKPEEMAPPSVPSYTIELRLLMDLIECYDRLLKYAHMSVRRRSLQVVLDSGYSGFFIFVWGLDL